MLRAVPDKTAAIIAGLLGIALPVVWPWMRAGELRVGPLRNVWLVAWLAFVAAFIGLGYLGAQPPENDTILATQALTVYYFAFLLLIPPVLRRLAASRQP
jgi:quinol-cytochrome oxidoreductase complex cytochrome b subunit